MGFDDKPKDSLSSNYLELMDDDDFTIENSYDKNDKQINKTKDSPKSKNPKKSRKKLLHQHHEILKSRLSKNFKKQQ